MCYKIFKNCEFVEYTFLLCFNVKRRIQCTTKARYYDDDDNDNDDF